MSGTDHSGSQPERALRRSLALLRGRHGLLALIFVLTALIVVTNLAVPALLGGAVDAIDNKDESLLIKLGLAIVGVGVVRAALTSFETLATGRLAIDVERSLRNDLYSRFLELDDEYLQGQRVGQMVSRIMVTSGPIRTFLSQSLAKIASDLLTVLFAGIAMMVVDARLAVVAFWPVPIVIWLVVIFGRKATPLMRRRQEVEADLTASAEETLEGLVSVELLGAERRRQEALETETARWHATASEIMALDATYDSAIINLPNLAWAGLFAWGGFSVIEGGLGLGTLVTFLGYVAILLGPIQDLGTTLWRFQNATASAQRVFEVLDREPTITSAPDAPVLHDPVPTIDIEALSKSYGGPRRALDDVRLAVESGDNVALIGRTGSGKSSLLRAIARVYDPEGGEIRMGGQRLDEVDLGSLRSYVRFLGPTPHLFVGTVLDNLRYGRPDATREEVVEVTRALRLHDRLLTLPDGYDTSLGAGGLLVPVPTAQWICIGRALVTLPRLLLLDDVTAPMPPQMQSSVVEGIRAMTARTTIVAVANRPALLSLCDRIVVLVDGEVAAVGTRDELRHDRSFVDATAVWGLEESSR